MMSPEVATYIYNHKRDTISEMEERSNVSIRVVADSSLNRNDVTIETDSARQAPTSAKR